ncbi:L-histidine N(alpha)-methyltransferase, partial [Streptomyces cyaneofuscatus]
MHAITIPEPGGPEALVWAEVPDPVPGDGEVLVEVVAGAVNRADVLQRQGFYNPPPGASPYPGLECAGRIAALGPGVTGWALDDFDHVAVWNPEQRWIEMRLRARRALTVKI